MRWIFLLLVSFPLFTKGQIPDSAWQAVVVDELVQASFPAPPSREDNTGYLNIFINLDTAVFIISRLGSPISRVPAVRDRFELDQYYDGMASGIVNHEAIDLLDTYDITVGKLAAKYLKYSYTYKPDAQAFGPLAKRDTSVQVDFRETLLLLIDSSNYVLHHWYMGPDSEAKQQNGKTFLQSLSLLQDIPHTRQFAPDAQAIDDSQQPWAQFRGEVFLFMILFVLILLGYFGVRWMKKRRMKN